MNSDTSTRMGETRAVGAESSVDDPVLSVENLEKVYATGDGELTAVDDVSFTIERGEIVGLLGPNGAGKTTTIKSILGLTEPTAGRVKVEGIDPHEAPEDAYRHISAVLEGARNLYWRLTVRENLRYFTGLQGIHPDAADDEIDRLISLVDLEEKADETVQDLSRGMQQKACLACSLARETPVLFLDEPTLGLDVEAARTLRSEIRRLATDENRTIVLSSHDMDVIQDVCDRVIIMNEGRVIEEDTVDALVNLFTTQAYRVTLAEPLPADASLETFDPDWDDDTSFSVTLEDSDDFYRLTNRLEAIGAEVRNVNSLDADLEDIFLSIIETDEQEGGEVEGEQLDPDRSSNDGALTATRGES